MTDDAAGYVGSVPRSREENRRLVELRPPAWGYMLYAGALLEGVQALDRQYRAPEARTTHRQGEAVSATEALPFVSRQMAVLSAICSRSDGAGFLDPRAADAAFGPAGESGDVEGIRARRWPGGSLRGHAEVGCRDARDHRSSRVRRSVLVGRGYGR